MPVLKGRTFMDTMTDREHDLALKLLSVDGYIAYLLARQDGKSHVYAMRQGWLAR
jgi:hypothetical protein